MSLGKWKLSKRRQTTESSGNGNMSSSSSSPSSSPSTTRASTPISELGGSSNIDINHSKGNTDSRTSSSSPFSWLRSSRRPSKRKSIISSDDPAFARLHKPFTPENLEHQKLFSAFEWTFDDDNDGVDRRRNSLSLSPCASRSATVDDYAHEDGYGYEQVDPHHHILPPTDALSGSLARLSTREAPGGRFDRENTA
ncbi:hypothetical protein F5B17DRAFT_329762 [Nemania serpens]|nr:hypothetical protein F5B17DRAFT_329762 [Nemania serpens]